MDPSLKERLMAIVGTESFSEELVDIVCSSYDASDHWERPWAVLWPKSTQEISRILKLANAEGFPVIPRGAGTGLAGGAVPVRGGIVLDLCRMNRILEIRVQDPSWLFLPARPCQRCGLHPWRQRGHQRRWAQGS